MVLIHFRLFSMLAVVLVTVAGCFTSTAMNYTIDGQVIDATGRPVPEVSITLQDGPGTFPDLAALTDAEGRFTLHDLSVGRFTLRLVPPEGEPVSRMVEVGNGGTERLVLRLLE